MNDQETIKQLEYELSTLKGKYETPKTPIFIAGKKGIYVCPSCHKRTFFKHSHCHYCGQMLGWRNKETRNGNIY